MLVGKACQWLRTEALATSHSNKAEGGRYNREFSELLKGQGFDAIDKSTRSRLLCILDNIDAVEKWLATVHANKRLTLNHPHTIWRAYQRTVVKKPDDGKKKKPSHVEQLKASLIESQEEVAKFKREAESRIPFTYADTARSIAVVVYRTVSPSKAREVARELNRLVRAAEAEDETVAEAHT